MANNGVDSREQLEYRRRLEEMLQLPENKYCADCGTKGLSYPTHETIFFTFVFFFFIYWLVEF
jgi:hypothetical protein